MNKLVTLQGYKNKIQKKENIPDEIPVYYDDFELGFSFAALLPKLPSLSLPALKLALPAFPPFPPISLPPLPPLPSFPPISLPPLPSFPLPSIPPINITPPSIPALPPVKITPPPIPSLPPIKISPPAVNVNLQLPKIDAKIPPPNQWKVNPEEVKAIAKTGEFVGRVGQVAGGVVSFIPGGQAIGAGVVGASTKLVEGSRLAIEAAEKIEKINQIKAAAQKGSLVQGLQAASGLASSVGAPANITDKINTVTNVVNQGNKIQNFVNAKDPIGAINATNTLLNQTGVSPTITSKIDTGVKFGTNLINTGVSSADKLLNVLKPGEQILNSIGGKLSPPLPSSVSDLIKTDRSTGDLKTKPPSIFETLFPQKTTVTPKPTTTTTLPDFSFLKDPSKDPSSPLYVPPAIQDDKTDPNKKPQKLPSTGELKKESGNMGIFLIAGIGILFLTQGKKKKKK